MHTERGNVAVEAIRVGDRVYARNRQTGKVELRAVTALVPQHKGKLLELRIAGERESLRPSFGHPFWVKRSEADSGHWIHAANLVPGELLETIDGNWAEIQSVTPLEREEIVYNFTVANDHDYFVGETGFLVHNASGCGCRYTRPWVRKWVRDEVEEAQEYTEDGLRIDPNSGVPYAGPPHLGHAPGFEFWKMAELATQNGLTQQEFNEMMQDPEFYNYEEPISNMSHCYEEP